VKSVRSSAPKSRSLTVYRPAMENLPPVLADEPAARPTDARTTAPSPADSSATLSPNARTDDHPEAHSNAALLSPENLEEIGWGFPTSVPDPSSRFERHDIEVRTLSHTDDRSAVLHLPGVPLNTDAFQLKRIIGAMLDEDYSPPAYLLFMGRRVHDAAVVRDIVRHIVCSTSSACYWR
jgi:hypothetical protein